MREQRAPGEIILERRSHPRLPLRVDVTCNVTAACFPGTTTNLTVAGLFLETDTPVPLGAEVELTLELPGDGEPLKASGRVVRLAQRKGELPGFAVEFVSLDDVACTRIDALVQERLADFARQAT